MTCRVNLWLLKPYSLYRKYAVSKWHAHLIPHVQGNLLNSDWYSMFTTMQKDETALRLFVFLKKNITRRVCRCFHAEATLANIVAVSSMQTGATLLHYASPITEQLLLGNSKLNKHFLVKQGSYGTMKKSWNFINLVQEFWTCCWETGNMETRLFIEQKYAPKRLGFQHFLVVI